MLPADPEANGIRGMPLRCRLPLYGGLGWFGPGLGLLGLRLGPSGPGLGLVGAWSGYQVWYMLNELAVGPHKV